MSDVSPYEEINELIEKMEEAKETLEGTDLEYFGKSQLEKLNRLSNQIAAISYKMVSAMEEQKG